MPDERSQGEGRTIAKRAGIVALFTLLSRILGYVRDTTLGHVFGAGVAHDAYVVATTIPNLLRRLVAEGSLMIAFIPLLSEEKTRGGLPAMRRFTSAVLGVLIPVLLILTGIGMLFPDEAVTLFAAGFDEPRAELAAELTRVMMGFLFFISLTALASGVLNTQGIFGPPAAAPMLLNVAIITAAILLRSFFDVPIHAVAWGFLAGGLLQLLLQIPFLMKERMLVWPRIELKHPSLLLLGARMLPAVFGVAVYQLNIIIIRQIASFLPRGHLSCYFWATRLEEFALGVFAVSISIAALPTLSEHAANKDATRLFATFRRALRATNFVTVPAMVGLFTIAEPIVGVLFRHGEFSAEAGALTAQLVRIMAFAIVPVGIVRVMVPTYYAIGDTKTPVAAASASMLTTGLAGWLLKDTFGIAGLTTATLLAAMAQVVVLSLLLSRRVERTLDDTPTREDDDPSVLGHALKCGLAIAPGGLLAAFVASTRGWFGGDNFTGALYLGGLLGVVIVSYFALAKALRLAEGDLILGAIRRKVGR